MMPQRSSRSRRMSAKGRKNAITKVVRSKKKTAFEKDQKALEIARLADQQKLNDDQELENQRLERANQD